MCADNPGYEPRARRWRDRFSRRSLRFKEHCDRQCTSRAERGPSRPPVPKRHKAVAVEIEHLVAPDVPLRFIEVDHEDEVRCFASSALEYEHDRANEESRGLSLGFAV